MDTSKEYIEMCRKATEIQELWEMEDGDFVSIVADDSNGGNYQDGVTTIFDNCACHSGYHDYDAHWYIPRYTTWLPRQDQLQKMHEHKGIVDWDFYSFVNNGLSDYLDFFTSMEQLWLAFVMHEKYNKHWNGKDWGRGE